MRRLAGRLSRHGLALCALAVACSAAAGSPLPVPQPQGNPHEDAAADFHPGSGEALLVFDIPAQPLAGALGQYSAVTGRPAVFRSSLIAGRTSPGVRGSYSAKAALRLLLDGTGLSADETEGGIVDAFVLKPADRAVGDASVPVPAGPGTLGADAYDGVVQARVWEAYCGNPETVPGSYRALLRFRVDPLGRIERARLIGPSGNARRDAALLDVLRRVQVDIPPPPGMPQPLVMLILPHGQIAGRPCVGSR